MSKQRFIQEQWDIGNEITAYSDAAVEYKYFCKHAQHYFGGDYRDYLLEFTEEDFADYIEQIQVDEGWFDEEDKAAVNE